jgi:hypothetical protein
MREKSPSLPNTDIHESQISQKKAPRPVIILREKFPSLLPNDVIRHPFSRIVSREFSRKIFKLIFGV